jgi:hypothetical protein
MGLEDKITESIILAMKAKDKIRLESLRAVKSAILIEKTKTGNKETLDKNQSIKLLQKLVKQRNDSAKIYKEQNRDELAEIEESQSKIISEFLPKQLSEAELTSIIDEVITATGAESIKDMAKVIGATNSKVLGRAEGRVIANLVKSKLNSF